MSKLSISLVVFEISQIDIKEPIKERKQVFEPEGEGGGA